MDKFIQEKVYLKTVKGIGRHGEDEQLLSLYYPEELEEDKEYNALLFKRSEDGIRNIELNHCILDIAMQCFSNRSFTLEEYGGTETIEGLHIKEAYFLKDLGNFLGYLNNCTSFRAHNGQFEDFDKLELTKRLERVKKYFQ